MCIRGSAIGNPYCRDLGHVFSWHLEKQASDTAKRVTDIVKESKDEVILNIYGFSRGGIGAFLLCQKLKHLPRDRLTLNVISYDPVPGNFISSARVDLLTKAKCTLSAAVTDLSHCQNLANMLILFANEPLEPWDAHAPLLPICPKSCKREIDVTPGCHGNAVSFLFNSDNGIIEPSNIESIFVFYRTIEFMQKHGSLFDLSRIKFDTKMQFIVNPEISYSEKIHILKNLYDSSVKELKTQVKAKDCLVRWKTSTRQMHLCNTIFTRPNIRNYLNRHHQQLCSEEKISDDKSILSIADYDPKHVNPKFSASSLFKTIFIIAMFWIMYQKFVTQSGLEDRPRLAL